MLSARCRVQMAEMELTQEHVKIANIRQNWATYQVIMAGRLITLDKFPGVHPVGVRNFLLHKLGKCIIAVCGEDDTEACGIQQLCLEGYVMGCEKPMGYRGKACIQYLHALEKTGLVQTR
eukprot:9676151-Ditylum_brightwellii.AAC.1